MPELPEVERGRLVAASVAEGRRVAAVRCADDPIVFDHTPARAIREALLGRSVVAVKRWGKQLWFELDRSPHPLFHFGMSGAFRIPCDEPLQLKSGPRESSDTWPPPYWKICLTFHDAGELVMTDARRLGRILLRDDPLRQPPLSRLGFDPIHNLPPPRIFSASLRARSGVIKSLLLDQSFCAGVGNWIADEVLFQAGIDPRRRASSLSDAEAKRLRAKLKAIVQRAVRAAADDSQYPRSWLFHRRWGKQKDATTAAGHEIRHDTIGGRTTAWVPKMQR